MGTRICGAIIVLSIGALVGCAPAASEEPGSVTSIPGDNLIIRSDDGLSILDVSQMVQRDLGEAVFSGDLASAATVTTTGGGPSLTRLDILTGAALDRVDLDGYLEPTVMSPSGNLIALSTPREPGATAWLPDGREATTIAVAAAGSTEVRSFELDGNYEPEAFSTDGSELFMIEYIPALDPDRYRVRRLRLRNGKIVPIGRNKLAAPEQMRGTGRMQVLDPSGEALYTLYTRQGPNYSHGAGPAASDARGVHAFVHLLNLEDSWAHCIDLPQPFGTGSATASAITMSLSGGPLYVTDWSNGAVAVISPSRLKVRTVKQVDLGAPDDRTFAQSSWMNGLLYAAGNDTVAVLSTRDLEVTRRWTMGSEITGLLLSPDGDRLYVGQPDGIVILDAVTGEELDRVPLPGITSLEAVSEPTT